MLRRKFMGMGREKARKQELFIQKPYYLIKKLLGDWRSGQFE